MPDEVPPAGTAAPAATTTPAPTTPATPAATTAAPATTPAAAAPAATPPAATVEPTTAKEGDPNWLKQRIEQNSKSTQAKFLKDLGVTTIEEAKAKIEAAKKLEDDKKSEIQRVQDQLKALEPEAEKAKRLETTVTAYAAREMGALTEAQKTTIIGLAGEDPAKQLETIEKLKAGGLLAAPPPAPAATTAAPAGKQSVPAPVSTTGAGGAPTPASPTSPDHKAVYEKLRDTNPMAAAHYALRNEKAIFGDGSTS
jgi:hypothetical protein